MPTPNVELLLKTYRAIQDNPEDWYQDLWRCKTGMCFAGWATTVNRDPWAPDVVREYDGHIHHSLSDAVLVDGKAVHCATRAEEILGLTEREAGELFEGSNDMDDLGSIILNLTGIDPR